MSELEYLEQLMGQEFMDDLVAAMSGLLGTQALEFTVDVAHLDKSPKVTPQGKSKALELADILFHLRIEDLTEKAVKERAYLFQVKQSANENGASTRRQKKLYEWLSLIRIDKPREIDPSQSWRNFSNPASITKSGFWYMHDQRKSVRVLKNIFGDAPPILTHVDGTNAFASTFNLSEFLAKFLGGSVGRSINVADDWSLIIKSILKYKRNYKPKKRFNTGTFTPPEYFGFKWMGTVEIRGKVMSLIAGWMDKLWALVKRRPFIVISIEVKSYESSETMGRSAESKAQLMEREVDERHSKRFEKNS